jgi:hypothetical protein
MNFKQFKDRMKKILDPVCMIGRMFRDVATWPVRPKDWNKMADELPGAIERHIEDHYQYILNHPAQGRHYDILVRDDLVVGEKKVSREEVENAFQKVFRTPSPWLTKYKERLKSQIDRSDIMFELWRKS